MPKPEASEYIEYTEFLKTAEERLQAFSKPEFKSLLRPGIRIFPLPGGDFNFIYSDDNLKPIAILFLEKVIPGDNYPMATLLSYFPGGIYDLSCYVTEGNRRKGINRELLKTAEIFVKAKLKQSGILKPALLSIIIGVPPEQDQLLQKITSVVKDLGYGKIEDRVLIKKVDPSL